MTRNEKATSHTTRKASTLTERELQHFLERNRNIVPAGISLSPAVCIGRNIPTDYGIIDCLFISPTGGVTMVVSSMNADQVIAITDTLRKRGMPYLDEISAWYTYHESGRAANVIDIMADRGYVTFADEVEFVAMTNTSLQSGSLLVLAVGEEIKAEADTLCAHLKESRAPAFNMVFVEK